MASGAGADYTKKLIDRHCRNHLLEKNAGNDIARFTRDIDIWLDPTKGIESWSSTLTAAAAKFKKTKFTSARSKKEINPAELNEKSGYSRQKSCSYA